jgi:NAD(P)-dependent dehydrogenase (short-subunit alcohol dehydrogenase family)
VRGLAGKVALVTGAGSGLGEATSRRLDEEGARIVVVDVAPERASRVAADLREALAVTADISDESSVDSYMAQAIRHFGGIDLYHLNAGIAGAPREFPDVGLDDYDAAMAVNARGTFLGLRAALRQYARQGPAAGQSSPPRRSARSEAAPTSSPTT